MYDRKTPFYRVLMRQNVIAMYDMLVFPETFSCILFMNRLSEKRIISYIEYIRATRFVALGRRKTPMYDREKPIAIIHSDITPTPPGRLGAAVVDR